MVGRITASMPIDWDPVWVFGPRIAAPAVTSVRREVVTLPTGESMTLSLRHQPRSRLFVLAGIAVALVALLGWFATGPLRSASADAAPVSQGKPATASSSEGRAYPASAAVDGDTGTRWSSAFSDPQWLQVDLGSPTAIGKVVLNWERAYATAYQIQISSDGSAWSTVYSTTTSKGGNETLTVTGTARYVRLYGTARSSGYGYSLWEFQVFGTASAPATATVGPVTEGPVTAGPSSPPRRGRRPRRPRRPAGSWRRTRSRT
jgi:hypothetical protein